MNSIRPIDVEGSDDEIQLVSPTSFPQARNQRRRRNRTEVIVIEEDEETRSAHSGVQVEIVSSHNCRNQPQRAQPKSTINSRESYVAGKKASKTKKVEEPPKEPTFSCPICMSEIVSPFSTTCGHIFCEQCIKTAIGVRKICPTCRTKLSYKNSIHKVILPAVSERSPN